MGDQLYGPYLESGEPGPQNIQGPADAESWGAAVAAPREEPGERYPILPLNSGQQVVSAPAPSWGEGVAPAPQNREVAAPPAPQEPVPVPRQGGYQQQVPMPSHYQQPHVQGYYQQPYAPAPPAAAPGPDGGVEVGRHRSTEAMGHVNVRSSVKLPPERGWRRWLMLLTRINMGLSPDEVYERELHAKIRKIVTPPPGTVQGFQVAVLGLKGGVGKTTTSVLLGSVTAMVRGERILAIDANPDSGNLIDRASRETTSTVAQLVASAGKLTGYNAVREHTNKNDANLEVLASAEYVDAAHEFSGRDWDTTRGVVSPFYPIVIADCGVGLHTDATRAVLDTVWGIVVVTDLSADSAKAAGRAFDWLRERGYGDLAARAVAVINHTREGRGRANVDDIKTQLARDVGEHNVFELPFDPHIEEGGPIDVRLVSGLMRRRVTEIAAALSEWFDKPRPARR